MSYRHQILPAWGVHTTSGRVPFSFHTDKHFGFIPYRFQAIFMPASCEREAFPEMILFRFQIIPASCERGLRTISSFELCYYSRSKFEFFSHTLADNPFERSAITKLNTSESSGFLRSYGLLCFVCLLTMKCGIRLYKRRFTINNIAPNAQKR